MKVKLTNNSVDRLRLPLPGYVATPSLLPRESVEVESVPAQYSFFYGLANPVNSIDVEVNGQKIIYDSHEARNIPALPPYVNKDTVIPDKYKWLLEDEVLPTVKKYKVTVNHKDKATGAVLKTTSTAELDEGVKTSVLSETIPEYTLDTSTTSPAEVVVAEGASHDFLYNKVVKKVKVKAEHKDVADGRVLETTYSEEVPEGTEVTMKSIEIDGYTVVGAKTHKVVAGSSDTSFDYEKVVTEG